MADESVVSNRRLDELGVTTTLEEAAEILGIGRTKAYELAKAGEFPAKVIRVGRRYRVSVPAIIALLQPDP